MHTHSSFRWLIPTAAVAGVLIATGCATLDGMRQVRFEADPTPLDHVQKTGTVADGDTTQIVKVQLSGGGLLEYKGGRSERVHDDFWQAPKGPHWHDLVERRTTLSEEDTRRIYQALVDAGIFDRHRKKPSPQVPAVTIQAKMRFERAAIITDDPACMRIFSELLGKFGKRIPAPSAK